MTDAPQKKLGFFRTLLTEDDLNQVWCPVRLIGASGFVSDVGMTLYNLIAHGLFDAMAFGTGLAAIIASLGTALGIKAKWGG